MNNTYTGIIDTFFFSLKALSLSPPLYFLLLFLFFLFLPSLPLYDLSLSTPCPHFEKCQGPLAPPRSPRAQLRREAHAPDQETEAQKGRVASQGVPWVR